MIMKDSGIRKREKGITVIGAVILLGVVGFMLYVIGFITVPMYLDYYQIRKGMDKVSESINSYDVSKREVAQKITRHFSLEYTQGYDWKKPIVNKKAGKIVVDVIYKDQRKLFDKLHMVLDVNEQVQLYP